MAIGFRPTWAPEILSQTKKETKPAGGEQIGWVEGRKGAEGQRQVPVVSLVTAVLAPTWLLSWTSTQWSD